MSSARSATSVSALVLFGLLLAGPAVQAQDSQPGSATTTVQTSAPLTKKEQRAQKKQQKSQEKAASEQAKAQKSQADAIKHQDKATDAAQKAGADQQTARPH